MASVREITTLLENFAPLSLQESYDNAGLLCGDPNAEVHSILVTLDITEEVIDEAIREQHNLIISHHPLIFQGIKKLLPDTLEKRCLIKAIRHDLNIYSAHTNLDSVFQGVSGRMADKLGLSNRRILQPTDMNDQHPLTGFGIIGELPSPVDSVEFLQTLKTIFQCSDIRHTAICKAKIERIALCGGSGAFLIPDAIAQNADLFLTGECKYHDFFRADNRLIIADIGHYESEQYTKEIFYELVTKKIPNFAVQFSKVNTNPIYHI